MCAGHSQIDAVVAEEDRPFARLAVLASPSMLLTCDQSIAKLPSDGYHVIQRLAAKSHRPLMRKSVAGTRRHLAPATQESPPNGGLFVAWNPSLPRFATAWDKRRDKCLQPERKR